MSWWSNFSGKMLDFIEKDLFEKSGVEVTTKHVTISRGLQLYTVRAGALENPVMVILHGFGSASVVFYKTLEFLSKEFRVILVDLLGMGRSSRPEFVHENTKDSELFFVNALEAFRVEEGLERFVLCGHSFGGYVAGCYAHYFPAYVEKLIFLAPVGFPQMPKHFNYLKSLNAVHWVERWIMKILVFFWIRNITPFDIMRKTGPVASAMVKFYSVNRFKMLPPEEAMAVSFYLQSVNTLNQSGECALIHILQPGAWAYAPLSVRLEHLEIPMGFIFGEHDWVIKDGVDHLQEHNNVPVLMKVISDADHHLYFDKPSELSHTMIGMVRSMSE